MFFTRYGEASYYDAAVWARGLAEAYCCVLLRGFGAEMYDGFEDLSSMCWRLPDWAWQNTAYQHAVAHGSPANALAVKVGMHLSSKCIDEDLNQLRWYGNAGAHTNASYLSGSRLGPDPGVVVSVVRVACSRLVWHSTFMMVSKL